MIAGCTIHSSDGNFKDDVGCVCVFLFSRNEHCSHCESDRQSPALRISSSMACNFVIFLNKIIHHPMSYFKRKNFFFPQMKSYYAMSMMMTIERQDINGFVVISKIVTVHVALIILHRTHTFCCTSTQYMFPLQLFLVFYLMFFFYLCTT